MLGEGHYAQTYIAISSSNEILACKMINKKQLIERINNSKNKTMTKDFFTNMIQMEALAWSKLKHQNIAQFKGYKETQNNVYFFLEYCNDG
jgi:serine/threonine protein kinase